MVALSRLLVAAVILSSLSEPAARAQASDAGQTVWQPDQAALAHIPRVAHPPKLEDFLGESRPENQVAITSFRQFRPGDGTPATHETTAYLSYDDKSLYVVFVCKDDPQLVRAHLAKREDIANDDQVSLYLDTFQDHHRSYLFATNPLGIQLDGIYTEGQGYDYTFDTLWYSEGRLTDDGYIVWMAIPFKSLRFSDEPVQSWGIALNRMTLRANELVWWPYVTQRKAGIVQQFGTATGLSEISPGRNLQFIPYGLLSRARFLDQTDLSNRLFRTQAEHHAGLDAKFVLHDALTFDFTVNPDFSQVESDDPQVTINQRFRVFFPEKRPFFIENAGFFQTPINLFFSRNIVEPQFGGRVTGKLGKWTLGALLIDDRAPGRGRVSPFDTRARIGVVRVSREFGQQSQVGIFFSSRDFVKNSNRVAAFDTRLKLSQNWFLEAQAVHSWTVQKTQQLCEQPGQIQGNAWWMQLSYSGRHFAYIGNYDDKSPNFCAELGFVPRTDVRLVRNFAGYFWRPEHRRILAFGPSATSLVNWNRANRIQDWEADLGFEVDWTRQTTLNIVRGEAFELFRNIGFRKHATAILFSTEPFKWLAIQSRVSSGTNENFFPAAQPEPLLPFLGNSKKASLSMILRPWPRLRIDQTYFYTRLGTRVGSTPLPFTPGHSIFNNHIVRTKMNYQFTKELSLRAIVDYRATLANPQLLDVQTNLGSFPGGPVFPTKRFSPDLLLTYLLHPGTALYIGYTDQYANLLFDPLQKPSVFVGSSPSQSVGRQVFVKFSYLFRF